MKKNSNSPIFSSLHLLRMDLSHEVGFGNQIPKMDIFIQLVVITLLFSLVKGGCESSYRKNQAKCSEPKRRDPSHP